MTRDTLTAEERRRRIVRLLATAALRVGREPTADSPNPTRQHPPDRTERDKEQCAEDGAKERNG